MLAADDRTAIHDLLARGRRVAALGREKARSEFLVVPVLLATREFTTAEVSIYSGQRLDVSLRVNGVRHAKTHALDLRRHPLAARRIILDHEDQG